MKFLIVLLAAVCVAQAQIAGGWVSQTAITEDAMDIARWSTSNLAAQTNANGFYTMMSIRNLKTQVVSGINYKFTLDVILGTPENKYYVRLSLSNFSKMSINI
jgi:hypothetical protein